MALCVMYARSNEMTRNDLCWCGSGKKYKKCHMDFDERIRSMKFDIYRGQVRPPHSIIKNAADIEGIKKSGVVNDGALDLMGEMVQPGVDTATLDKAAHDYIIDHGGIPACLNFEGFPKSVCISINDVVCHGIPSKKTILKEGDIVNVDITTILDGYYADASRMYIVGGRTTPEAARLIADRRTEYIAATLEYLEGIAKELAGDDSFDRLRETRDANMKAAELEGEVQRMEEQIRGET